MTNNIMGNYSDEKNVQILISLLKKHNIRKVIASPGATNVTFVASIQNDPFFEIYSSVDERSAAYLACGLSEESMEPVILSCTGATASRNYLPGLTEAYYRKLPILAITSSQIFSRVGQNIAQVIDRSIIQNDVAKLSVTLPIVKDEDDFWECEIKTNQAILELKRRGGGPVHINLPTNYTPTFSTKVLPNVRKIERFNFENEDLPTLKGRIGIFIGSHKSFSIKLTEAIETFCERYDAIVFCDHTSGYKGKFRVQSPIAGCQLDYDDTLSPDIIINMGEITGDYYNMAIKSKEIWRLNEDGELKDAYRKLKYIFEMPELFFFKKYSENKEIKKIEYYNKFKNKINELTARIIDLPFSNMWIALKISQKLPEKSIIHFGILNSLRSWNFFEIPNSVKSATNVGGFGIDGILSSLIGASFTNKDSLYFCVLGDLAFFYDMNVLGNRHVSKNLRILLVNNGKGTEFKQYKHSAATLGDDADEFVAAAGHFGNKSKDLVKNYSNDLGFEYLTASRKEDFLEVANRFLDKRISEKPILLEVFTNSEDESNALKIIMNLDQGFKSKTKDSIKELIGESNFKSVKNIFKKK